LILVLSTSSPVASVALFRDGEERLASCSREAPMAASGACLKLLDQALAESGSKLADVRLFVADVGPGSFTGVRVGVTLAKTFAYVLGARAAGVSAFDLISADRLAAIPSRKGEWFVREPGREPYRTDAPPPDAQGYGAGVLQASFPLAERAGPLLGKLLPADPEALVPTYIAEPSISMPKKPYRTASGEAGRG
jgi:tRNA A37 threonylcarbamoyladenosine modification protein TsaB